MESFITFDTAKIAKEKGFDYKCQRFYNDYKHHMTNERKISSYRQKQNWNEYSGIYSAPTQESLNKWLRDNHNIDVWVIAMGDIDLYVDNAPLEKTYQCRVNNWKTIWSIHDGTGAVMPEHYYFNHEKYEEALEMGLKKGLELINE